MTFYPAQYCVKFSVEQTVLNQAVVNTFWMRRNTPWDNALLTTMMSGIAGVYNTHLVPRLVDDWELNKVTARDFTTYDGLSGEYTPSPAIVGLSATDPWPPQVATVVSWRTNKRGRSYRGRTYLAGWADSAANGAALTGTEKGAMSNWAQALINLANANSVYFSIVSFYNNSQPRGAGVWTEITSFVIQDYARTQRRRSVPNAI